MQKKGAALRLAAEASPPPRELIPPGAIEEAVEGLEPHWRFAGADMLEVAAAEPAKR